MNLMKRIWIIEITFCSQMRRGKNIYMSNIKVKM